MASRLRVLFLTTVVAVQAGPPAGAAAPRRVFDGAPSVDACAALGFQTRPPYEERRRQYGGVVPAGAKASIGTPPAPPAPPPPPPPLPSVAQAPSIPPLPVPPVQRRTEEPGSRVEEIVVTASKRERERRRPASAPAAVAPALAYVRAPSQPLDTGDTSVRKRSLLA